MTSERAVEAVSRENGWDELRRLAEAATPGPWFEHNAHGPWVSNALREDGYGEFVADTEFSETGRVSAEDAPHASANAAYIAAVAPDVVLRLLRERDLAIAHDTQPYPTAWAYEQACRVRDEALAALAAARGEPGLDVERLARVLRAWENNRHPLPSPDADDGPHTWDAWIAEARKLLDAAE